MEHTHQHGEGHDHHHHDDDQELVHSEQHHLIKVMKAFAHYKTAAMKTTHKKRRDFHTLSQYHKDLIPTYLDKLNRVDNCIDQNMILITDIVKNATTFLGTTPEFDHVSFFFFF